MRLLRFLVLFLASIVISSSISADGLHSGLGQAGGLQVSVNFLNPSGHTYADASGIHYNLWDYYLINENLYYKSSTWGQLYPLYFLGQTVDFTVKVTNVAPGKRSYRLRVIGLANELRPPFTIGHALTGPQEWIVLLGPGETKTLMGHIALTDPNTSSGLDIVHIQLWNKDM